MSHTRKCDLVGPYTKGDRKRPKVTTRGVLVARSRCRQMLALARETTGPYTKVPQDTPEYIGLGE